MLNALKNLCDSELLNNLIPYLKSILNFVHDNNWYIVSDYCLDNSKRNDVLSFVIIPHNDIEKTLELVNKHLPSDIKKSRKLGNSKEFFFNNFPHASINFILENRNYYLPQCNNKKEIKHELELMLNEMIIKKNPESMINELKKVIKNFQNISPKVFKDIILIAHIFGYLSAFLRYNINANKILWIPDEDKTTTNSRGLLFLISEINLFGYQTAFGVKKPKNFDLASPEIKWADPFIRLADFYAGTLSILNSKDDNAKITHFDFLYKCMINKKECTIFKFDFKDLNRSGIVKLSKKVNDNEFSKITKEFRK